MKAKARDRLKRCAHYEGVMPNGDTIKLDIRHRQAADDQIIQHDRQIKPFPAYQTITSYNRPMVTNGAGGTVWGVPPFFKHLVNKQQCHYLDNSREEDFQVLSLQNMAY